MPDVLILAAAVLIAGALIAWDRRAGHRIRRAEPDPLELPGFVPGERDEWRRHG